MKTDFTQEILRYELETIVGPENVITDQAEMDAQSLDVWWVTRFWKFSEFDFPKPYAIVFAENKEQVIQLLKFCNEHKIPFIPRGGGAGDSGGALPIHGGIVVDLKTTQSVNPRKFSSDAAKYHYFAQMAFYYQGALAINGNVTGLKIIAVEKSGEHDVGVFNVTDEALAAGQEKIEEWVAILEECKQTGIWTGKTGGKEVDLYAPAWYRNQTDDEIELNIGGETYAL